MSAESHKSDTNNWLFVKIYTDTGVYGVGEGSLQYKDLGLIGEIQDFSKFLIGKDPFAIEYIWTSLYRRVTWTGGAVTMSAISAIDLALWDLKGKALGMPIYDLLGGKVRDKMPVYASSMKRDMTPLEEAKRALHFAKEGYKSYKLHSAVPGEIDHPADQTIETVTEIRNAVGDEVNILVDVNGAYSVHHAIEIGKQLEQ